MMSRPQTGHGPEVGARDADVLELGVELADGRLGELDDVAHERLARVLAGLDVGQPVLPVAGQAGAGQRVLAEQADHVQALLGDDQRAAVALDVADLQQPLDDRRARGRGADPRVLHRLAQLLVVDELAGGLHRRPAASRRCSAAAAWSPCASERPRGPSAPRPARAWAAAARGPRRRRRRRRRRDRRSRRRHRASPGTSSSLPRVRNTCSATVVSTRVFSNTASGWKTARKRRTTRS